MYTSGRGCDRPLLPHSRMLSRRGGVGQVSFLKWGVRSARLRVALSSGICPQGTSERHQISLSWSFSPSPGQLFVSGIKCPQA